jgi:hypothetical protein
MACVGLLISARLADVPVLIAIGRSKSNCRFATEERFVDDRRRLVVVCITGKSTTRVGVRGTDHGFGSAGGPPFLLLVELAKSN